MASSGQTDALLVPQPQERKRKEKDLKTLISERQEELERLNGEYESLLRAKAEQELLIAKLSSSSSSQE